MQCINWFCPHVRVFMHTDGYNGWYTPTTFNFPTWNMLQITPIWQPHSSMLVNMDGTSVNYWTCGMLQNTDPIWVCWWVCHILDARITSSSTSSNSICVLPIAGTGSAREKNGNKLLVPAMFKWSHVPLVQLSIGPKVQLFDGPSNDKYLEFE